VSPAPSSDLAPASMVEIIGAENSTDDRSSGPPVAAKPKVAYVKSIRWPSA
jgi:hypothetical protein